MNNVCYFIYLIFFFNIFNIYFLNTFFIAEWVTINGAVMLTLNDEKFANLMLPHQLRIARKHHRMKDPKFTPLTFLKMLPKQEQVKIFLFFIFYFYIL